MNSLKKFIDSNPDNSTRQLLSKDVLATNIYTLASKENPIANLDYTHKVVEIQNKISRENNEKIITLWTN